MITTPNSLARWWLCDIHGIDTPAQAQLDEVIAQIQFLREKGYTGDAIVQTWQSRLAANTTIPINIDDISMDAENLINAERYYHPRLMIAPHAVISSLDENGNVIHHNLDNVSITYVKYFTVDDIIDYYYSKFSHIQRSMMEHNRDRGAILYLLKKYTLDQLLFIIDAACVCSYDEDVPPPQCPLDIQKYEREGLCAYLDKVGYSE